MKIFPLSQELWATVLRWVGIVGVVTACLGAIVSQIVLNNMETGLRTSLDLANTSLEALQTSTGIANSSLGTVRAGLRGLHDATSGVGDAFEQAETVLDDIGDLVQNDLSKTAKALDDTMPGLIQVAGTIDGALTALNNSPIALPYDDRGFTAGLKDLNSSLEHIPKELEKQGKAIKTTAKSVAVTAGNIDDLTKQLNELEETIQSSVKILNSYEGNLEEASKVLKETIDNTTFLFWILRILSFVFCLSYASLMVVPLHISAITQRRLAGESDADLVLGDVLVDGSQGHLPDGADADKVQADRGAVDSNDMSVEDAALSSRDGAIDAAALSSSGARSSDPDADDDFVDETIRSVGSFVVDDALVSGDVSVDVDEDFVDETIRSVGSFVVDDALVSGDVSVDVDEDFVDETIRSVRSVAASRDGAVEDGTLSSRGVRSSVETADADNETVRSVAASAEVGSRGVSVDADEDFVDETIRSVRTSDSKAHGSKPAVPVQPSSPRFEKPAESTAQPVAHVVPPVVSKEEDPVQPRVAHHASDLLSAEFDQFSDIDSDSNESDDPAMFDLEELGKYFESDPTIDIGPEGNAPRGSIGDANGFFE